MDWGFIAVLLAGIVVMAVLCGWFSLRQTKGTERGSLPGKGDHVIDLNYNSGGGGGTQMTSYTVPKDPQDYAKRFVPQGKNTEN
jgi:hypothetical protein